MDQRPAVGWLRGQAQSKSAARTTFGGRHTTSVWIHTVGARSACTKGMSGLSDDSMTTAVITATSGGTSRMMLPAGSALTCLGNLPEPPLVEQHKVPA